MKVKFVAGLIAAAAALMAGQAHAGAVGIANMNVTGLGFATPPAGLNLVIAGESRTGTADASYNGVVATGVGAGSITLGGAVNVDVKNRCAGACGPATAALYNGPGLENATNHIAVPGSANYALGDMFISGQALGGSISGLTRADAVATGPNNIGGANATILNSGVIRGTFTVGTSFTSSILLQVDAFLQAWIDPAGNPAAVTSASAGYGWNMKVQDAFGNTLDFKPADLNQAFSSSDSAFNGVSSFSTFGPAVYLSNPFTFVAGRAYQFSINQSSNATVSDKLIPEPAGLALIGIAAIGAGLASRRRKAA